LVASDGNFIFLEGLIKTAMRQSSTAMKVLESWRVASGLAARIVAILILALPLSGFGSIERLLAPSKDLWPRWAVADPASTAQIDHTAWSAFLQKYLVLGEVNRVRYAKVATADRRALETYIAGLALLPITKYNRAEQLAYWINLYNAMTVELVLEYYPIKSIRDIDISPGWFAFGPWDKDLLTIEGQRLSLNDIEHRILRPIWNDPRLHYALNCASLGCPNLAPVAFTAENADQLLEQGARDFINGRAVTLTGGRLIVSSIYDWFIEDFGGSETGVLDHLRKYAAPPLAAELAARRKIDGEVYDWRLNDLEQQ
jgi:Protein of unknown function, DUF547